MDKKIVVAAKSYIFKDHKLLILHKSEYDRKRGSFPETGIDLPGGKLEFGESFEEALNREIAEEVRLCVNIITPVNTWSLMTESRQILCVEFLCDWESGDVELSHEHESFEWLTLEQIRQSGDVLVPDIERAFALYDKLKG